MGYSVYQVNRGSLESKGGMAVFVRSDVQVVKYYSNEICQSIVIKRCQQQFAVVNVYIPPASSRYTTTNYIDAL